MHYFSGLNSYSDWDNLKLHAINKVQKNYFIYLFAPIVDPRMLEEDESLLELVINELPPPYVPGA